MSKHFSVRFACLLLALGVMTSAVGCKKKPDAQVANLGEKVEKMSSNWKTPNDQQCQQFAENMEQAIAQQNVAEVNNLIDMDAILERVTANANVPEKARQGFMQGAKRGLDGTQAGFGGQIIRELSAEGSYHFLHVHQVKEQKRVLFRLLSPQGVNYHDYIVALQPDGKVRAIDIHLMVTGETVSQTMRRAFIPFAVQTSKKGLARLTASENAWVKHIQDITRMIRAMQSGQFQQVVEIYDRLPKALREEKVMLLQRIQATAQLDEQQYIAAMEDYRRLYPKDPALDILSIDRYLLKKQYKRCLACIDRLDKAVGEDPYMDVMRANVHTEMKEYDKAKQFARQAIEKDKRLIDGYWSLVSTSLMEKDFAETTRLLKHLEADYEIVFEDLATIPDYAEYVKSPQYQEWLDR